MTSTAIPHTSKHKPCGCSGNRQCGCSNTPELLNSFSRPNFFAGQMLTDEDLRDAMNYFVQKNRLHNRHFLGEGVVCGLQVVPHPCTDQRTKVIIKKGHAVNGCGDDILVGQEQQIDIFAMIRELLVKKHGRSDCGDPCRDAQFDQTELDTMRRSLQDLVRQRNLAVTEEAKQTFTAEILVLQKQLENLVLITTPVKYGLYVRYEERLTDFVTPYQTDNCGNLNCHGSRIREGYSFELRCATKLSYPDLRAALDACGKTIPDYDFMQGQTLHSMSVLETAQKVLTQFASLEVILKNEPPKNIALERLREDREKAIVDFEAAFEDVENVKGVTVEKQHKAVEAVLRLLALSIRSILLDVELDSFKSKLKKLANEASKPLIKIDLLTKINGEAQSTLKRVPDSVITALALKVAALVAYLDDKSKIDASFDYRAMALGELVNFAMVSNALSRLQVILVTLKSLMASGSIVFAPELRNRMYAIDFGLFSSSTVLTVEETFRALLEQASIVNRAVAEVGKNCMCYALLPPCPEDMDAAVLVAEVTVSNCEIVEVCNLARRMVVSGPALRYWFSDFNGVLDGLRASCCPSPDVLQKYKKKEEQRRAELNRTWNDVLSPSSASASYTLDILSDDAHDYLAHIDQWKTLAAQEVDELDKFAIAPIGPAASQLPLLLALQRQPVALETNEREQQVLNVALSQLAGRPDADLRNILAWSEQFGSPAEIRKLAELASASAMSASAKIEKNESAIAEESKARDAGLQKVQTALENAIKAESKTRDKAIGDSIDPLRTDLTKETKERQAAVEAAGNAVDELRKALTVKKEDGSSAKIEEFIQGCTEKIRDEVNNKQPADWQPLRNILRQLIGLQNEQ